MTSVAAIAATLNVDVSSLVFVDDSEFELNAVEGRRGFPQ